MNEKKLKILVLVDTFYPVIGGVCSVVDQSCCALSKYADVTVGAVKAKNYIDKQRPYKIIRCAGYYNDITNDGMAYPEYDKNFRNMVENGNFDIIHCHTAGNFMIYAQKVSKKLHIPLVTTVHSYLKPDIKSYVKFNFLTNMILSIFINRIDKCDYIWAVSNFCRRKLKSFGIKNNIDVVYNAVDFTPQKNIDLLKEKINKMYGITNQTFVMSFISRIIKDKNIDLVIESIKLLKNKNYNFKVFVVGDGNYLNKTKKLIKKHNLQDYFICTGMIKDRSLLSAYYARTNLLLFPSYIDSAGLIHIEGATYKIPTLTISNVAQSENIQNYYNGLIANNNAVDYANYIDYAYNNKDLLVTMGENAYKTLYRRYDDEKVVIELLNNYKKVVNDYNLNKEKILARHELKNTNKSRNKVALKLKNKQIS